MAEAPLCPGNDAGLTGIDSFQVRQFSREFVIRIVRQSSSLSPAISKVDVCRLGTRDDLDRMARSDARYEILDAYLSRMPHGRMHSGGFTRSDRWTRRIMFIEESAPGGRKPLENHHPWSEWGPEWVGLDRRWIQHNPNIVPLVNVGPAALHRHPYYCLPVLLPPCAEPPEPKCRVDSKARH